MKVLKAGGSCLKNIADFKQLANLAEREKNPVLVCSAVNGVTDELLAQMNSACSRGFSLEEVRKTHMRLLEGLAGKNREACEESTEKLLMELGDVLTGLSLIREASSSVSDRVMAFGERLAVELVAAYLNEAGLKAKTLVGAEAGMLTDGKFGNASLLEESYSIVKKKLEPLLKAGKTPVIAGFVGADADGKTTTLGRGGSDYTASFTAAALECECVLLKDTQGLLTADPKLVPHARLVSEIEYLAAVEVGHYGSRVLFEKAVMPALRKKIPLVIKPFNGDNEGTRVCANASNSIVITAVKKVASIDLFGSEGMLSVLAKLAQGLEEHKLYPLFLTESSATGEISVVVQEKDLHVLEHLLKPLMKEKIMNVDKGLGMVSLIGSNMRERVGVAASIFNALAEEKIPVFSIAQSASERSISVIISEENVGKAARALHKKFVE